MLNQNSVLQPHVQMAKTTTNLVRTFLFLVMLGSVTTPWCGQAMAEHSSLTPMPFDRIKALVGTWQGTKQSLKGQETIIVEYSVTAKGSAVMERFFPGTPKEMVSIYTQDGHELTMTHYCILGNQPRMQTHGTESGDRVTLHYVDGAGMRSFNDTHMHELTITFQDTDRMTHQWTLYDKGQKADTHTFAFSRR